MDCPDDRADPTTAMTTCLSPSPASGALATAVRDVVVPAAMGGRGDLSVRLSLIIMDLGMAYMFLAMLLGVIHTGGGMPSMPGMGAMPGM
jgi:hypothetical protein